MIQKGSIFMETERLIIRPLQIEDAQESFDNWTSDREMTKYTKWEAHKSVEFTNALFTEWNKLYRNKNFYQWLIVLKEENKIIGAISAFNYNEKLNSIELGYCIGSKWWHHGYTQEAARRVIEFLFENCQVNRIEAKHDIANPRSGNVMKGIGMQYEGTLRKASLNVRGVVDVCIYSILANEYFGKKANDDT